MLSPPMALLIMDPFMHRASLVPASSAHNQHDFRMGSEKKQPEEAQKEHSLQEPVLWE
jgi:hypothetical protein